MSSQEDVFADAGLPSMSTGPDMSQGFGGGSPAPAEDYTEEEQQLLRQVEEQNEERKRMLYEKMQKESEMKRERKAQAQIKLQEWKSERDQMAAGKKQTNEAEAAIKQAELDQAKSGKNPWVRIVDNCEMNASQYVGGKDVSRMRAAMLARKDDITKAGGMKKAL